MGGLITRSPLRLVAWEGRAGGVTAGSEAEGSDLAAGRMASVVCGVEEPLARAWADAVGERRDVWVLRGSVLDADSQAVVRPSNSYGWMLGGVDAVYAQTFPSVEQHVRSAVL